MTCFRFRYHQAFVQNFLENAVAVYFVYFDYHMAKFPNLIQQFLSGLYFCLFQALFFVEITYN